jgi:hypothetical protein
MLLNIFKWNVETIHTTLARPVSRTSFALMGTLGDPGQKCVQRCATLIGARLGWSPEQREEEIETFYQQIKIPQ